MGKKAQRRRGGAERDARKAEARRKRDALVEASHVDEFSDALAGRVGESLRALFDRSTDWVSPDAALDEELLARGWVRAGVYGPEEVDARWAFSVCDVPEYDVHLHHFSDEALAVMDDGSGDGFDVDHPWYVTYGGAAYQGYVGRAPQHYGSADEVRADLDAIEAAVPVFKDEA